MVFCFVLFFRIFWGAPADKQKKKEKGTKIEKKNTKIQK